jgi:hypothetical protein
MPTVWLRLLGTRYRASPGSADGCRPAVFWFRDEENCYMAKVLLTGSPGAVGRAACPVLEAAGWAVEPFDLTGGKDLRDEAAVRAG